MTDFSAPNASRRHTLEHLSDWLGTRLDGRHSALDDAVTTARFFVALLPKLRDDAAACRHRKRFPPGNEVAVCTLSRDGRERQRQSLSAMRQSTR